MLAQMSVETMPLTCRGTISGTVGCFQSGGKPAIESSLMSRCGQPMNPQQMTERSEDIWKGSTAKKHLLVNALQWLMG